MRLRRASLRLHPHAASLVKTAELRNVRTPCGGSTSRLQESTCREIPPQRNSLFNIFPVVSTRFKIYRGCCFKVSDASISPLLARSDQPFSRSSLRRVLFCLIVRGTHSCSSASREAARARGCSSWSFRRHTQRSATVMRSGVCIVSFLLLLFTSQQLAAAISLCLLPCASALPHHGALSMRPPVAATARHHSSDNSSTLLCMQVV